MSQDIVLRNAISFFQKSKKFGERFILIGRRRMLLKVPNQGNAYGVFIPVIVAGVFRVTVAPDQLFSPSIAHLYQAVRISITAVDYEIITKSIKAAIFVNLFNDGRRTGASCRMMNNNGIPLCDVFQRLQWSPIKVIIIVRTARWPI